jgi:hypothetical protein
MGFAKPITNLNRLAVRGSMKSKCDFVNSAFASCEDIWEFLLIAICLRNVCSEAVIIAVSVNGIAQLKPDVICAGTALVAKSVPGTNE